MYYIQSPSRIHRSSSKGYNKCFNWEGGGKKAWEKVNQTLPVLKQMHIQFDAGMDLTGKGETCRMCWQDSIWVVPPPQIQTVKKTTSRVVENIIWRAYVAVSLMDSAKVIAPRSPEEHSTENVTHKQDKSSDLCLQAYKSFTSCRGFKFLAKSYSYVRVFLQWLRYTVHICTPLTRKHHHVLEIGFDLVASSKIKKKWERVDVSSSTQEHRHLGRNRVKERTTN